MGEQVENAIPRDVPERLFDGEDWGVLERALDEWGYDTQEMHAIEEIGELLTALMQYRRRRVDQPQVRDEIADVVIVANQLAMMYGREEVEAQIEYKLNRLDSRIDRSRAVGGESNAD